MERKVKLERTVKLFFFARFCLLHIPELRMLLLSIGNSSQRNTLLVSKVSSSWDPFKRDKDLKMARIALLKGI